MLFLSSSEPLANSSNPPKAAVRLSSRPSKLVSTLPRLPIRARVCCACAAAITLDEEEEDADDVEGKATSEEREARKEGTATILWRP